MLLVEQNYQRLTETKWEFQNQRLAQSKEFQQFVVLAQQQKEQQVPTL
jgi:hypothetical protein